MLEYPRRSSGAVGDYAHGNSKDDGADAAKVKRAQDWFATHVTLYDQPYTLDFDQARAVCDFHKNTLVVARAGSGKTRVIVAKVTFLVAWHEIKLSEIAIFMFNRTAAAEVNQRIAAVKIDGKPLTGGELRPASTFHKFALDVTKHFGFNPQIIDEHERITTITSGLDASLENLKYHASAPERRELLNLTSNFINRAGQKFPGNEGLARLEASVEQYTKKHSQDSSYTKHIFWHKLALSTYQHYTATLKFPKIDFNMLMATATQLMNSAATKNDPRRAPSEPDVGAPEPCSLRHLCGLKYIMVDEYQDFSYLFYALTVALRRLAPAAHLFAVGDDWQAINRFAGSDVNYFINFKRFFSEDAVSIPLATNYRSAKRIVMRANYFMLTTYDPQAIPAQAFSHELGKIKFLNPAKQRFDFSDIKEDALGDGRFQKALAHAAHQPPAKVPPDAARLLKTITKIVQHHAHSEIMLLHRHNFTSFEGIDLEALQLALKSILLSEHILTAEQFERQIRFLTMHRSKGLESEVVILLEVDRKVVASSHPHATIFELFGDTRAAEIADQKRLLYVAMTRAKHNLYVLSSERTPLI